MTKYFKIIPKFLRLKNVFVSRYFKNELRLFEKRVLSKMIRKKEAYTNYLKKEVERNYNCLKSECNKDQLDRFNDKVNLLVEREREIHGAPQKEIEILDDKREIKYINYSDYKFSSYEDAILKKGPKHILADEIINIKDTIPKVENMLSSFKKEDRDSIRTKIQDIYQKNVNKKGDDVNIKEN